MVFHALRVIEHLMIYVRMDSGLWIAAGRQLVAVAARDGPFCWGKWLPTFFITSEICSQKCLERKDALSVCNGCPD